MDMMDTEAMKKYIGIHGGISNADYHGARGISKSGLDQIHKSPAHYRAWKQSVKKSTPEMEFGTAVHYGVLEPQLFGKRVIRQPEHIRSRNSNDWKAFRKEHAGKVILKQHEYAAVQDIILNVRNHPVASKFFDSGLSEQTVYFEEEGQLCKCRPDFLTTDGVVIDVKTTKDASYNAFQKSISLYRYHVQGAFYLQGVKSVCRGVGWLPEKINRFVIIAVEKTPPYAVALYELDYATLEKGREAYKADLARYAQAMKEDRWPAYPEQVQSMNLMLF
jgi:exodeoxyribonuclease VIII